MTATTGFGEIADEIAQIAGIRDIDFPITGNVLLNAAAGIRKLSADLLGAAEIIEAIAAEVGDHSANLPNALEPATVATTDAA